MSAEAKRLHEERKPDFEKLFDLGEALANYKFPSVETDWARDVLDSVRQDLRAISFRIGKAVENSGNERRSDHPDAD